MASNGNDNVQAISITKSVCNYMPSGFENVFKNVEGLEIGSSALKVIRMSDLRPFPKLKNVWFPRNRLTSLDGNLFAYNPNLKIVGFHENHISSISSRLLSSLSHLTTVYLSDNVCINKNATSSFEINDLVEKISEDCGNSPVADPEAGELSSFKTLLEAMQDRHNQEIAELKRYIEAALKSQLSALEQKIASKSDISQLSELISELKNKTGKLQTDISQLVSDHDQLTTF